MELATRTDVLILELISCSPSVFSYADKQMLKSREPDVIERLIERKVRRLRWNAIIGGGFALLFLAQIIATAVATERWQGLVSTAIWVAALTIYVGNVIRSRGSMREACERLVSQLKQERAAAPRAG